MVKAIIAVTSYNEVFYADGVRTGLFVTEALHPYRYFVEQGIDVDFVSETGTYGVDGHSLAPDFLLGQDKKDFEDKQSGFNVGLSNIKKASDVDASQYDIFFASAGHACMFDYPTATALHKIALDVWARGGVVAAVCHGPSIFENLIDPKTKDYLIKGKTITGFTDVGEEILQVDSLMKEKGLITIQDIAKKRGAKFVEPEGPWADFSLTDGKLVTGVNPQSATSTAQKAVAALKN